MLMKKIIILSAALLSFGLSVIPAAQADTTTYYQNYPPRMERRMERRAMRHQRQCTRVVYKKVCHRQGPYVKCHQVRYVYHAC